MEITYFTEQELNRLLVEAYASNHSHGIAIELSFFLGLRVSELLGLTPEDFQDGQIVVKRLKKSRHTMHSLRSRPHLLTFIQDQTPGAKMFPITRQGWNKALRRYCQAAGIHSSKAHSHSLKHSTAMHIWSQSQQLGDIQAWLGHRSASSTMAYLRIIDGERAQQAMDASTVGRSQQVPTG